MVDARVDALGSLLRGELAAMDTYQLALEKLDGGPGTAEVRRILSDHREAVDELRQQVRLAGGGTEVSTGVWGAFARAVEGVAALLGNAVALEALKQGEQIGIRSYERALAEEGLSPVSRQLIASKLLPQTREHLPTLDRLIS